MSDILVERFAEDMPKTPVVSPDTATAPSAVGSNGENGVKQSSSGSHTSFSSVEDLRKKEPAFYDLMMQGSVINFIKKQEKAYDRIKEINRQTYQRN